MLYRAKISFAGKVSMTLGEVGEISDPAIAKDLIKAGYVELIEVVEEKETKKKKGKVSDE